MLPPRFYGTVNSMKPFPDDGSLSNDDSLSDSDYDVSFSHLSNQTQAQPLTKPRLTFCPEMNPYREEERIRAMLEETTTDSSGNESNSE
ncbi:unnamed protein product [Danaus chrysippus]|uniref:(African queen) hypothetical protein n=1 Tax=Danaus chrysippus TaxID=151541 RepID=A0A8J2QXT6_9NEOP|nr:unnamed protein product [Danaus chrysippus]